MTTVEERFEAIDAHLARTDAALARLAEQNALIAETLIEMDASVRRASEAVGVLGGYIDATIDYVQRHEADPDAHGGEQ